MAMGRKNHQLGNIHCGKLANCKLYIGTYHVEAKVQKLFTIINLFIIKRLLSVTSTIQQIEGQIAIGNRNSSTSEGMWLRQVSLQGTVELHKLWNIDDPRVRKLCICLAR